jgi:uncharacterized secreted repeat protein (TIGR03808 family)
MHDGTQELLCMSMDRRRLFAAFAGVASAGAATPALARDSTATPRAEIDATALGLRPNAQEDQSTILQRAIERAAAAGVVLRLPSGDFRVGALQLPPYAAVAGVPGTTRLIMAGGPSLLSSSGSDHVSLSGLVVDGNAIPLANGRGLIHLTKGAAMRIADCEIVNAGGNGITLEEIAGEVKANTIAAAADNAIFSNDAAGLRIAGNTIRDAGNGGILVWRSKPGDDGTLVVDNRVEDIANKKGGSGQWGNGINMFRADNVIVRGNRIRNAAYSAIRGNTASNLQIAGNTCRGMGEVAIFVEFDFQGAVVADNIVDGAACGVAIANLDKGGRLAVVQGNLIRNLRRGRPAGDDPTDAPAIGIAVEADTAVSGNVIDNVEGAGIQAGWGEYLRDVSVTANVVRGADYGIAVSVAPGAGTAVIANNLISGARLGAIVGMEWTKIVADDLGRDAPARYAQLSVDGNRVR